MCTAVVTFNELERQSEFTKGWALAAKNARNAAVGVALTMVASAALDRLVKSLAPEKLGTLSKENKAELTAHLQDLHSLLAACCRRSQHDQSRLFRYLRANIENRTEDLGDIIEDLVLSEDEQFKALLADCVRSISAPAPSELVARM
jgi:hypothetical protein